MFIVPYTATKYSQLERWVQFANEKLFTRYHLRIFQQLPRQTLG